MHSIGQGNVHRVDVLVPKKIIIAPVRLPNAVSTRGALGLLDVPRCDCRNDSPGVGLDGVDEASRIYHGRGQDAEADGGPLLLARLCARPRFHPLVEEGSKLWAQACKFGLRERLDRGPTCNTIAILLCGSLGFVLDESRSGTNGKDPAAHVYREVRLI